MEPLRPRRVVEPDHGHVPGHAQPAGADGLVGAERHQVVGHEHRAGRLRSREQPLHGRTTARGPEVPRLDPAGGPAQAGPGQGGFVALPALHGRAQPRRPPDQPDPAVAEGDEVCDRPPRPLHVRHRHSVHVQALRRAVDRDEGKAPAHDRLVGRGCQAGDEDDAGGPLRPQRGETGRLSLRVVVRVAQQERPTPGLEDVLDPPHHRGEERVLHVRDENTGQTGRPRPQAPCDPVRLVREAPRGRLHPCRDVRPDRAGPRQRARDRGGRDTRPAGHVPYGHRPGLPTVECSPFRPAHGPGL